jgi:AcrR family transcriptional regulator
MENKTAPKRTQAERSKKSKARIVLEATRLFGENGFRSTRMSDVAEAAGLTGPGLLHHYTSKEHLLVEVLKNRDRADQQHYEALFKNTVGMKDLEALQALVEHNQSVPEMVRLFTVLVTESIAPDHPGHEFFVKRYRVYRQQYLNLLQDAQQQGRIRKDTNVEQLSALVMAVLDGLQIQWLLDPEQVDMVEAFKVFAQILNQGIQEKTSQSPEGN